MARFADRFPDVAVSEMLVLRIQDPGLPLPPGDYAFSEWYCDDPKCDCRRTLLQVVSPQHPGHVLATLNYGWESPDFYTRWMHGDESAGREITSASLDPLNPQSKLADALLDGFRDYVRLDSFYPTQLQRHYDLFKSTQTTASIPSSEPAPLPDMTTDEIIRQLQRVPEECDYAPYEVALLAAVAQREAITPQLIAAIDRVSANPAHYLKDHEDCLHLFAIYLLAEFRERRALDAFLRIFSLPGKQSLDLTGDMITEHGAAVFVSVCGGDPGPLLRLAHDESVNEFVRGQAIDGLLVQAGWRERSREAVIEDLRQLFQTLSKPGDPCVWAQLVSAAHDFDAAELLPEMRRAFAEQLVDEGVIGLDDFDPEVPRRPRRFPQPSAEQRFKSFLERNAPIDAAAECSIWQCFRDDSEPNDLDDDKVWDAPDLPPDRFSPSPLSEAYELPPVPFVAPPKVGRNEPCPCGSGKKFKKCCGKD